MHFFQFIFVAAAVLLSLQFLRELEERYAEAHEGSVKFSQWMAEMVRSRRDKPRQIDCFSSSYDNTFHRLSSLGGATLFTIVIKVKC